jgi:hypothetical protein
VAVQTALAAGCLKRQLVLQLPGMRMQLHSRQQFTIAVHLYLPTCAAKVKVISQVSSLAVKVEMVRSQRQRVTALASLCCLGQVAGAAWLTSAYSTLWLCKTWLTGWRLLS